jgi:hypothetical protein
MSQFERSWRRYVDAWETPPPPEGEGEHVSSSEETPEVTEIEVQDRQIVRKQSPRMNLSFGQILRRLAQ